MGLWDNLKSIANEVVTTAEQQIQTDSSNVNGGICQKDESANDEAPSSIIKSALSAAASIVIKTSKSAVTQVISNYHPPFSFDAISHPEDIRTIVNSGYGDTWSRFKLALNSLDTLEIARNLNEQIKRQLTEETESATTFSVDIRINDWNRKGLTESYENNCFSKEHFLREDYYQEHLILNALSMIERGDGFKKILAIVSLLNAFPQGWNNPVLSRYMATQGAENNIPRNDLVKHCRNALFYNPLESDVLAILKTCVSSERTLIYEDLIKLNQGLH